MTRTPNPSPKTRRVELRLSERQHARLLAVVDATGQSISAVLAQGIEAMHYQHIRRYDEAPPQG
jgi:hypothetical protein